MIRRWIFIRLPTFQPLFALLFVSLFFCRLNAFTETIPRIKNKLSYTFKIFGHKKKKILKKSEFDGSQLFSLQTLKFEADFTEAEKLHFLADPTIIQAFPQHVLMYTGTCYYFGL